jgi:hypothetical protein
VNPTRRALLGAGVATLGLSLALSIAPAWAKSNNSAPNGNGADSHGTVKLRDASTNDVVPETANDPYVCAFSIVFDYSAPTTGTWRILSWPPTGDGSQVSNGTWDTSSGADETDVLTLGAGHYRLEYQASDAANSSNKTFWVEDNCEGSSGSTGGDQPADTGSGDQGQDEQGDVGGTDQTGDTGAGDQGQDEQGETGSNEQPGDSGDQGDQGQDEQGETGSNEQPGDTGSGDQGQEGDVQGVTGGDQDGSDGSQPTDHSASSGSPSTDHDGDTQGITAPAGGDGGATLPNTATTPASVLSPLLAALGLLMVIAAHPFIRRSALADRA